MMISEGDMNVGVIMMVVAAIVVWTILTLGWAGLIYWL